MKRVPLLIFLFAMCLALSPPASASLITLTSGNSNVLIDPDSQAGMYDWEVDGYHILYQQWFWYRVGNVAEQPINSIGAPAITTIAPDIVRVTYSAAAFDLAILYSLTGGSAGSLFSDIAETITIKNKTATPLDFHFFQYSDFDLDLGGDFVAILGGNTARQIPAGGSGPVLSETVATPAPDHYETADFPVTLGKLNDGGPTTLNGNAFSGPGDVTWAFQWDLTVPVNGTKGISKDKQLNAVPEPAAIGLLGGVLVLVARKLRKRVA